VYYDSGRKRIYLPGGEGYISVFQQVDVDHWRLLVKVPSTLGGRTAGYLGKGRKVLTVFSWPSRRVPTLVPKCGSTRSRIKIARLSESKPVYCNPLASGALDGTCITLADFKSAGTSRLLCRP